MIEFALVVFILGAFAFPIYVSAGCLGLFTTWFFFRGYESFKNQPLAGKRILYFTWVAFLINIFISLLLAGLLAFMISTLIFDFFYLFIFNFIFCFLISLRWFDFSYKLFQWWIVGKNKIMRDKKNFFAVCKGFKDQSGFPLSPVFIDAGFISLENNRLNFDGSFIHKTFDSKTIFKVQKKSLEKLKIHTHPKNNHEPNIFIISLKNQFYPFRCRDDRDMLFNHLSSGLKTSMENLTS